jgi:Holliday junction resolvase RusA-like endonuclease
VQVSDANKKARPWKDQVAQVAGQAHAGRELMEGALYVQFRFHVPRPKGHYGTGRNAGKLKDSAPEFPAKKPDVLKLARAVEDAMTGVVYRDDAQIVREVLLKDFGNADVEVQVCEI